METYPRALSPEEAAPAFDLRSHTEMPLLFTRLCDLAGVRFWPASSYPAKMHFYAHDIEGIYRCARALSFSLSPNMFVATIVPLLCANCTGRPASEGKAHVRGAAPGCRHARGACEPAAGRGGREPVPARPRAVPRRARAQGTRLFCRFPSPLPPPTFFFLFMSTLALFGTSLTSRSRTIFRRC
jgi:hypothetical protein